MAEHGHKHGDLALGRTDLNRAAIAPVDLHGLARFIMHFLVDAAARRPNPALVPLITAPGDRTFTVSVTTHDCPEITAPHAKTAVFTGVMVTVPVSVVPGAAAPKTDCRNVT